MLFTFSVRPVSKKYLPPYVKLKDFRILVKENCYLKSPGYDILLVTAKGGIFKMSKLRIRRRRLGKMALLSTNSTI